MSTDIELAYRTREHDEGAFEELVRRHADVLSFQVNSFFIPGEGPEDIMQAALIGLMKAARTFSPDRGSGFRNFASLAIRAEILTAVKAGNRLKCRALSESSRFGEEISAAGALEAVTLGDVTPGPERFQPEDQVIAREEFKAQLRVIASSTPLVHAIAVGRLNGESYAALATRLGRTNKSIDNAVQKVRTQLKAAA
jgi:RNA polymerase sporulation-specific sigma factor